MNRSREIVLDCRRISHWFGQKRVIHDVNLKIIRGEIVALVGPSGCGKSTLLRSIVGTHPPCEGEVLVRSANEPAGHVVLKPSRDCGIVYQRYTLFPFLTAGENVALGLMLDQTSIPFRFFRFFRWKKIHERHLDEATALLENLKLGDAVHLYPHEMSGGMCQRVAIAQALILKPRILLLDEPFGALDEATREELQKMLLTLYHENCQAMEKGIPPPYTILIVTHELNEAIYVGDRVVGLSQYWNWREKEFSECPGATIVLDKQAPVFRQDELRDFEMFNRLRDLIRHAAFNPDVLQERDSFHSFWQEVEAGQGKGVLR